MVRLTHGVPLVVFLIVALALLGAVITVRIAFAHEYSPPFRWYSSTVTVRDMTSSYSTQIDTAIFDYNHYTEMTWSESPSGEMTIEEMDFGFTGWIGAAVSERPANQGWVACMSYLDLSVTGECNDHDAKARRATIYLNTNSRSRLDAVIDNAVLHEPGHAIGMAHTECDDDSVMKPGRCGNLQILLKSHDKFHINSWY